MAYQICLLRFEAGDVADVSAAPIRAAFAVHGIPRPEEEFVNLRDGLSIEVHAGDPTAATIQDILLEFRGVSEALFALVFDLMVAGQMTALVVDDPTIPLVLSAADAEGLPETLDSDFAPPVVCSSSRDVAATVAPEFNAWADWAGL